MRKYMNYTIGRKHIFGKHSRMAMPMLDSDDGMSGGSAGGGSGEQLSGSESDSNDSGAEEEDADSLAAQIAKLKAENQRFKNSINKLTEEKGRLTKKNREMMSADQIAQEEREERDRQLAELQKEVRTNRYSKKLVGLGMTETDADTFASTLPEMEDSDSFFTTLASFIAEKEKIAANKAIQDLLKDRPDIHAGNGEADKDDPAMALAKKSVEARRNNNPTGASQNIIKNYI